MKYTVSVPNTMLRVYNNALAHDAALPRRRALASWLPSGGTLTLSYTTTLTRWCFGTAHRHPKTLAFASSPSTMISSSTFSSMFTMASSHWPKSFVSSMYGVYEMLTNSLDLGGPEAGRPLPSQTTRFRRGSEKRKRERVPQGCHSLANRCNPLVRSK